MKYWYQHNRVGRAESVIVYKVFARDGTALRLDGKCRVWEPEYAVFMGNQ